MAEINKAPRGTNDVLPEDSYKWQFVENKLLETAGLYGYREIRVPVFEHTEVFIKNVGDTTDVVQKEMYTFTDKGDRSITLRPEFTAGALRSIVNILLQVRPFPLRFVILAAATVTKSLRLADFVNFISSVLNVSAPQPPWPMPRLLRLLISF